MARYDAYAERRQLARELADWRAVRFISTDRAASWTRRARRLGEMAGCSFTQIVEDLSTDADAIALEEEVEHAD